MGVRRGLPPPCRPLRSWLLGYCVALTALPFCIAVAGPLVVWWAANGGVVRSNTPEACRLASPALWSFVDEALYLSLATCFCAVGVSIIVLVMRFIANRIQRLWGGVGPAAEDVVRDFLASPPIEVAAGTECTICLDEGPPSSRWRELPCRHHFHEACLVQWFSRGHRCPLCRADLHVAYFGEVPRPDAAAAQGAAAGTGTSS